MFNISGMLSVASEKTWMVKIIPREIPTRGKKIAPSPAKFPVSATGAFRKQCFKSVKRTEDSNSQREVLFKISKKRGKSYYN